VKRPVLRPVGLLSIALALAGLPWAPGRAQRADVPRPNRDGDVLSTILAGQRGAYPQRQWLVVERDPAGLNCRDPQGRVMAVLAYGSVVDSDLIGGSAEAIVSLAGRPWLGLLAEPFDLQKDLRPRELRHRPLACRVRANASVVAPINPDTLQPVRREAGMQNLGGLR
jgi:hypothetical protein